MNNDWWKEQDIKISSAEYHNKSAFPTRMRKLRRWTSSDSTFDSSMSVNYIDYTRRQLTIFERKQREFSQHKVTRLKLQKYICVKRTCNALAKRIVNGHKNVFIAIGSYKIAANSPIKGRIYSKKA